MSNLLRQPPSEPAKGKSFLKRTNSSVRNQELAQSVKTAFERTSSNMAQAMEARNKQQEATNNKEGDENKRSSSKESKDGKKKHHHHKKSSGSKKYSTTTGDLSDALEEEILKYIGNTFDPLPDDQNADDVIDDLLPHPRAPARLQLRGHGDSVKSCCFDSHHRLLFTAGWDGMVLVWNLEKYTAPVARLQHEEWVNGVAVTYLPDLTVITITEDGNMFGWQCEDFMVEKTLIKKSNNNSNDQQQKSNFASSDSHRKFEVVAQIQVSYGALTSLVIHSDFNFAFASSGDTTFGVHLSAGSVLREYVTSTEATALATVDAVLCIAQRSGTITLYDVVGSFILRELTGHRGAVRCLSVVDSYTIMSAGDDSAVRVWNIASGACQSNRRRVHNRAIVALSHFYTDRDRLIVTAGLDGVVKVMRQSNGATISSFGLLCNCFCIVPPLPVDPSNVEDIVDMLTHLRAQDYKTEQQREKQALTGTNLWEDQQPGLEYTATAVFTMRNNNNTDVNPDDPFGLMSQTNNNDDETNNNLSSGSVAPGSPLVIPGTDRVLHDAQVSRHGRWSFFQTLMCGGPTGRLTRLSLESAVSRDNQSTNSAYSYM